MATTEIADSLQERLRAILPLVDDTRVVEIGPGALARTVEVFRACFGAQPAIIVADDNTFQVAGKRVCELLQAAGQPARAPYLFHDPHLPAYYDRVETLAAAFAEHDAIPIAVGSGTINDLTKLAAHLAGRPYMAVATAASMDGYTAYGASITRNGAKQTIYCPAPTALVADIDIISAAPPAMNAAGYADLLAKVVAGADWLLADALGIEPVHQTAWDLIQPQLRSWLADPAAVRAGDLPAIERLIEGLIMSGLGMQAAKSSRPASGAEHQFSHLWDMQGHVHAGEAPSHGFKVGIGTLATATLFARLLATFDPQRLDIDGICRDWPELPVRIAQARALHAVPDIANRAAEELSAKHVDAAALRDRLLRLRAVWPELRRRLEEQLLPPDRLRAMLQAAGAPVFPGAIGITPERLKRSYRMAQTIRSRYSILDLACETGMLDGWVDDLFRPGAFLLEDTC
jgi:glycerol-1-phosphate dehydrogenase [NAD(P)+]